MKLKAVDQIHVSSVRNTLIRPGEVFETSVPEGKQLIGKGLAVEVVEDDATAHSAEEKNATSAPDRKAASAPKNKAKPAPQNKAAGEPTAATLPIAE